MRRHLLSPQGQFPAAGLMRRLAAMFYDSLLCIALMMVVTLFYQQVLLRLLYGSEQLKMLAEAGLADIEVAPTPPGSARKPFQIVIASGVRP